MATNHQNEERVQRLHRESIIFLAHDHFPHLPEDFLAYRMETLDALLEICCVWIQSG